MDSISILWFKNNEQDACYQGILHKLLKINPGLTLMDLALGIDRTDTLRKVVRTEPQTVHLR